MRPYILEETNWKQIKNQKYDVAVLPWGATEPHNYHLPYGTDFLESACIAADSASMGKWCKNNGVARYTIVFRPGQIEMPSLSSHPPHHTNCYSGRYYTSALSSGNPKISHS